MRKTITLTESDLHTIIKESIAKIIEELDNAKYEQMIIEGVHYDSESDSFIFDFENDYETDIIKLKKVGYKVLAFNHCYYFGYQFETDIDSSKRTKFIHSIKFPDGKISERDKNSFIINAVNKLDSDITLPSYDLIVYPESMSEINREMLKYLNRFASPEIVNMELIANSYGNIIEFVEREYVCFNDIMKDLYVDVCYLYFYLLKRKINKGKGHWRNNNGIYNVDEFRNRMEGLMKLVRELAKKEEIVCEKYKIIENSINEFNAKN
jgi:hypothetical protein